MPAVHERLPELLAHLERTALVDAARLVGDLAAGGTPVPRIVEDLLAPAQVEVGHRWATARWSVAQEHAATAIIETVLTTASLRAPAAPPADGDPSRVLVCAEGEWHALAARMAAESLRGHGVAVTFLGPSLPSEVLSEFLADLAPTALGVSCSLGFALPGALRCVEAAHAAGVPALAAGRAFGSDGLRAQRLGADAWVPSTEAAVHVLQGWARTAPEAAAPALPRDAEWERLAEDSTPFGDVALRALLARRPGLESFSPALVQRLRKDVQYALRYAAAAQLVGDAGVLVEHARWLADVLDARTVPRAVVGELFTHLGDALSTRYPACAALCREAGGALRPAVPA